MTNNPHSLGIRVRQGVWMLKNWSNQIQSECEDSLEIYFDNRRALGDGAMMGFPKSPIHSIYIGSKGVPIRFPLDCKLLYDNDFIRVGTVLFHEVAHYYQQVDGKLETVASELSTYKNPNYYAQSWSELPHEIDAEFHGIMSMWNVLESEFPDKADACMLRFINWRTANTDYMIKPVSGGYASREQVEDAFDRTYETSLYEQRRFQPGFLRYEDEVSRQLTNESVLRFEYQEHYKKLIGNIPGEQKDRMMASLVLHLHPELKDEYPKRVTEMLDAEMTFDLPMPESSDESRMYLASDAFTNEIDRLSDQLAKGVTL